MTIILGHVIDALKHLPSESVHCVVTSPPYWGLRDYKVEPQLWGGARDCAHRWAELPHNAQASATCIDCNAWRGSLGLEPTPELYVQHLVEVFREVRRVLRSDGTVWLNLGDSYATGGAGYGDIGISRTWLRWPREQIPRNAPGLKPKDLVMIPARVALALQADGWWIRSDIIWAKSNPMPESVTDRPTKSHEYVFLLSKNATYFYDAEAIREESSGGWNSAETSNQAMFTRHGLSSQEVNRTRTRGHDLVQQYRNKRTVWSIPIGVDHDKRTVRRIPVQSYSEAHFATFPEELVLPCIRAGTSERGCCSQCGAPWERIVEGESADGTHRRVEKGWQPTCDHLAPIVPCTVLDPFVGSGTTLAVAAKNGRNSIGIELQRNYLPLMRARLQPYEADLVHPITVEIKEQ